MYAASIHPDFARQIAADKLQRLHTAAVHAETVRTALFTGAVRTLALTHRAAARKAACPA